MLFGFEIVSATYYWFLSLYVLVLSKTDAVAFVTNATQGYSLSTRSSNERALIRLHSSKLGFL